MGEESTGARGELRRIEHTREVRAPPATSSRTSDDNRPPAPPATSLLAPRVRPGAVSGPSIGGAGFGHDAIAG